MKTKSVTKNYLFNVIYQIFVLIVPLVTTPYISMVLGAEGVGQYSFTFSLTNYFVLLASLGFGYYAQREIAKKQDDIAEKSIVFYEIIIVRLLSVLLSFSVSLIVSLLGGYGPYKELMLWWLILIAAQAFDITFLFQGNEDFGKIVTKNILIKIVSIVLIFLIIRTSKDTWLYVLCYSCSIFLGNLSLWVNLHKYLIKIKLSELKPLRHLKPTLRLFIPTIAVSVYTLLDKTLIGLLIQDTYIVNEISIVDGVETTIQVVKRVSDLENGYYEQSEKIVKVALTVLTSLGTVLIPRNSKYFADHNFDAIKKNVNIFSHFIWMLGIPMTLGLIALSSHIVPWFLGNDFEKCILLIQIFSPLILIIGFSNLFGTQYLIPVQKDKQFTIAIVIGALTNLILNCVLIPFFWSIGAIIASIAAETTVTITMYFFVRKEISIKDILSCSWKYLIAGGVMFLTLFVIKGKFQTTFLHTVILIGVGIVTYFVVLLCLKDKFLFKNLTNFGLKIEKNNKINLTPKKGFILMVTASVLTWGVFSSLHWSSFIESYQKLVEKVNYEFNDPGSSWIKDSNYPVVGDYSSGSLFDPCVIKVQDTYYMYLSWRTKKSIALTTSIDGKNWSDLTVVLEGKVDSSWEEEVNRCSVIVYNNKFYMWYTGQSHGSSYIGLATSDNGLTNWVRYSQEPIISSNIGFEKNSVMNPSVLFDEKDKLFKMWYAAGETYEPDVIGYAESSDGIIWIKEEEPVFSSSKSYFEKEKVGGPDVHLINDEYYLFYIGYSDVDTGRICLAKSKNGKNNWQRSPLNPLVESNRWSFDRESCYKPAVIWDEEADKWMLWYNGRTGSKEYIGFAYYNSFDLFEVQK